MPLAFVLGGVSVIFLYFSMGPVSFYIVASKFWDSMTSFTLVAIPMYVFMAMILEKSGVAHALYRMMHLWFGAMRGGLAIGTVAICAIFAAMSGISGAAVVTMGTIALPRMLERGYDTKLSLGAINAGGGWGILIPPSIPMVLYALISEVSVGRLFASGIGPGILLFVLVTIYIGVRSWLQPSIAPALPPEERGNWREKLVALRAVLLPIMIVVMVLGSIFGGLATPTEAAAHRRARRLRRRGDQQAAVVRGGAPRGDPDLAADHPDHVDPVRRARLFHRLHHARRARLHPGPDGADPRRQVGRAGLHAVRAVPARHGDRPGRRSC